MPPALLVPVPTRPRSNPFRRRRGAAPLLLDQAAAAAAAARNWPADSSTSASSCFYSEVISASSTSLAEYQRPEKRPRHQDADEARPAGSECSEVEASESSCLGSVLESDLACPEQLADTAEATEYSSAFEELTPPESEEDEEILSGPCRCAEYSLSPVISSPLTEDDSGDAAPSATFSRFLDLAKQFIPCVHPEACAVKCQQCPLLHQPAPFPAAPVLGGGRTTLPASERGRHREGARGRYWTARRRWGSPEDPRSDWE